MKLLSYLVVAALTMTVAHRACWAGDKREEKPRFKGVELYSWKDEKENWMFVLLDGTNRLKTEKEVKEAKNKVRGAEKLNEAIARLAVGEQVSWTHRIGVFEFPPESTRQAIAKAAKDANVELNVGPQK